MTERMLGVGDIAVHIGLKLDTLYTMSNRGELPPPDQFVGLGRTPIWEQKTIDEWNEKRSKR